MHEMLLLQHMARRRRAVISGEASSEAHQQRHVRYPSFHIFLSQKKKEVFERFRTDDVNQKQSGENRVHLRFFFLNISSLNTQRPKAIRTMYSGDFFYNLENIVFHIKLLVK